MIRISWYKLISSTVCVLILIGGCDTLNVSQNQAGVFVPLKVSAPDCTYGGEISSVEAVDAFTVKFTLCQPDAAFPAKIASPIFAVQDQDFLNKNKGDSALMSAAPNGTGAYKLDTWLSPTRVMLVPSSSYWGAPGLPALLDFQAQADPGKRYGYTTMVSVDGIDAPPSGLIPDIKANTQLRALAHPLANLYYIGINNTFAPFDQVQARKALAVLLNREQIVQRSFPQGSELAQQMTPASVQPGHTDAMRWYDPNPLDAANLLKEINFDFSQEITLAYPNVQMGYIESAENVANAIKNQFAGINIKLVLKPMPLDEFNISIADGKEMLFLNWFQVDYADGTAYFERPFIRQASSFGTPYTEIQKEILNSLTVSDPKVRQAIFDRLNNLVKEQIPLIPLGYAANLSVFRASVKNLAANAYYENFEDLVGVDENFQFVGVREFSTLWPADEEDFSTFRVTRLMYDTLLAPGFGNVDLEPLLAESWSANDTLMEWTFLLRYNVRFSNGASFDANDVVASFSAIWDASNVNHTGRSGEFAVFKRLFGNLLNAK
jgi:peptide/nickel transport system substrate-binding protein